jgi:hypothetical protein
MNFIKDGLKVLSISVPIAWLISLIVLYLL